MHRLSRIPLFISLGWALAQAQMPENLVADGLSPIPPELPARVAPYLEFRAATFHDWHPLRHEVLITTRFSDAAQLHLVRFPGGARRQLTFLPEPVNRGLFHPGTGDSLVFLQDKGGAEFYQLYRYDLADGRITLLTDGKSRNVNPRWSRSGKWLAYSTTRRNGKDTDIHLMDPSDPRTDRRLLQVSGGGWSVTDWSADDSQLLVLEYISINESYLHLVQVAEGTLRTLTPRGKGPAAYGRAQFTKDGQSAIVSTDRDSEWLRLARLDLTTGEVIPLATHLAWDVEDFELSPDGKVIAFVANEEGGSALRLLNLRSAKELARPELPLGVISGLQWHPLGGELAFTLTSARSPSDVYSYDPKTRRVQRWTESETGGLNPDGFREPQIARLRSFDGRSISALVYRPDPAKFPGKRPVVINIHGGPEGQSRPVFQARNNYYLMELGVAMVYPNVRGSSGYGKTFLTLDNGLKREDSVRDIGAVLRWIQADPALDGGRMAVMGGSYGGYMVLACLEHFNEELRAGVDVVGISNFVTFLENTQDYRRDLRRVEYGDERDPAMREFLLRISPVTNVRRIRTPLFVVQGRNDPRVPATESEQMVQAVRAGGGSVWYLLAKDEGHGFAKKRNQDYQFMATILFLQEHLLR